MNNLRLLSAVFLALPFVILGSYALPSDVVETGIIVVISAGLIAALLLAVGFIISTVLGAMGGGLRRR